MECRLHDEMDLTTHEIFIGGSVASYCDEGTMSKGTVDLAKVRPMLFDMYSRQYWRLGSPFARAWSVGKKKAVQAFERHFGRTGE